MDRQRWRQEWDDLLEAKAQFTLDRCPRLAASLAFYSLLALAPAALLLGVAASLAFDSAGVQQAIRDQAGRWAGTRASGFLSEGMAAAADLKVNPWLVLTAFTAFAITATTALAELHASLNQVWGLQAPRGRSLPRMLRERALASTTVLALGTVLLLSLALNALLSAIAAELDSVAFSLVWSALDFVLTLGVLTLLFAAVYKVVPDAVLQWRDAWRGAFVTAFLVAVGKVLIGWYIGFRQPGAILGPVSVWIALMVWAYLTGLVFYFGAELTEIHAARHDRVVARRGAVRVEVRRVSSKSPRRPALPPKAEP